MNGITLKNFTGFVLAGKKNNDTEPNKALLKIDGETLVERAVETLNKVFTEVVIGTNNPEEFNFIDVPKVHDIFPGLGPLAGIHSALSSSKTEKIFVLSYDMPFVIPTLIKHLLDIKTEESIVVPATSRGAYYLCGIYDKNLLPVLESVLKIVSEALNKKREVKNSALSVWNFVERIGAEIVDIEHERFYFNDLFFKIDSSEDFGYAKENLI